jgi:predicted dehydrogenase
VGSPDTDTLADMDTHTEERVVGWGVIGTGVIAAAFVEDLSLTSSGRAVAVGSRRMETAEAFADRFGIQARHDSYEALVSDPDVDVVYVATPHPMHQPNGLLALEAGKPVLVEKPFTVNAAQAQDLVASARAKRLFLMEAMWTRWLPHIEQIRRLLADGVLGDIVTVTADHGHWVAPDSSFRRSAAELKSGALLDMGVYPVSFASMVLGIPQRILSIVTPSSSGGDEQTSMLFSYASGAQALLNTTTSANGPIRATIIGTDARIEIDGAFYMPSSFEVITRAGERTRVEIPHEGRGLRHQADEVARCLREGLLESPVMPLDESISIMQTIDAVLAQSVP